METLQQAIRDAGNFGCGSGYVGEVDNDLDLAGKGAKSSNSFVWDMRTGIVGFEYKDTEPGNSTSVSLSATPSIDATVSNWTGPSGTNAGIESDRSSKYNVDYSLPAGVAARIIPGSDILVVRNVGGSGVDLVHNNDSDNIHVRDTGTVANACTNNSPATDMVSGICENDILMLSDCTKSILFQASQVSSMGSGNGPGNCKTVGCTKINHNPSSVPGNLSASWGAAGGNAEFNKSYAPGSELMKVTTKIFFVGIEPATAGTARAIPTLYVQTNDATPQPLVEGVETMQVLYGVDTDTSPSTGDGVANQYVTADNVGDIDSKSETVFERVVSVKIALVLRTINELSGVNRPATADLSLVSAVSGSEIKIDPPDDNRMRKTFNLTVELRNRATNL